MRAGERWRGRRRGCLARGREREREREQELELELEQEQACLAGWRQSSARQPSVSRSVLNALLKLYAIFDAYAK